MKKITKSEKETFDFAQDFARKLKGGETIGLVGDLGAGKTIFTKGLAKGLGVKQTIASPTFVLMKVCPIQNSKLKIKNLVHIDSYRIKNKNDLISLGVEEYIDRDDAIVVIEWADRVKKILPKKTKFIKLSNKIGDKREIVY